ncbi:hypothetical protein GGF46_004546 [Coemansia sp. RSA 552]|nr:hypothetical protein GGF46_004546 [Coemansia sp. RSA 552]
MDKIVRIYYNEPNGTEMLKLMPLVFNDKVDLMGYFTYRYECKKDNVKIYYEGTKTEHASSFVVYDWDVVGNHLETSIHLDVVFKAPETEAQKQEVPATVVNKAAVEALVATKLPLDLDIPHIFQTLPTPQDSPRHVSAKESTARFERGITQEVAQKFETFVQNWNYQGLSP